MNDIITALALTGVAFTCLAFVLMLVALYGRRRKRVEVISWVALVTAVASFLAAIWVGLL